MSQLRPTTVGYVRSVSNGLRTLMLSACKYPIVVSSDPRNFRRALEAAATGPKPSARKFNPSARLPTQHDEFLGCLAGLASAQQAKQAASTAGSEPKHATTGCCIGQNRPPCGASDAAPAVLPKASHRRLQGFGSGAQAGWIAKNRDRFLKTDGVLALMASIGVWLAEV